MQMTHSTGTAAPWCWGKNKGTHEFALTSMCRYLDDFASKVQAAAGKGAARRAAVHIVIALALCTMSATQFKCGTVVAAKRPVGTVKETEISGAGITTLTPGMRASRVASSVPTAPRCSNIQKRVHLRHTEVWNIAL